MKKVYRLKDLDCANCAAKMESKIKKIDGVQSAGVDFLTQRLSVEAEDGIFEQVMDEVVRVCKKAEPDCEIVR